MVHKSTVHKGGSVGNSVSHGVGNGMGGVNNRGGMDNRVGNSVVGNGVGNSMGNGDSLGVSGSAVIGDLSDVAVDGVRVVVHVLDPAVGKGNRVGALSVTGTIAGLSGVEVGVGVVVSDGVVVGVWGDLIGVHLGHSVGNRVGNSVGNHRGMVDNGGSMDNRGSMVDHRGGMNKRSSMGNRVSNNPVGKSVSYDTVGKTMTYKTMPNHSRGRSEDLRSRRSGGCKGCQSNKGLKKSGSLFGRHEASVVCTFILGACSPTDSGGFVCASF